MRFTLIPLLFLFFLSSPLFAQYDAVERVKLQMVEAGGAFMQQLTAEQQQKLSLAYGSPERLDWNNLPTHSYSRKGLPLGELNKAQKMALHRLLQTGLSDQGYLKAQLIIQQDQQHRMDVFEEEGFETDKTMYGHDYYYITFYGKPDSEQPWSWRFEGHHLSLHFALSPQEISVTPMFFGVDPRELTEGPYAGYSFMREESDIAHRLIKSFKAEQEKKARLEGQMPDDVLTLTGTEAHTTDTYGLSAAQMDQAQKEDLVRLIRAWVYNLDYALARQEMDKIEAAGIDKIHFAWAGSKEKREAKYYRIQGPNNIIEYDNRSYEPWHIHSLWRKVEEDYGQKMSSRQ